MLATVLIIVAAIVVVFLVIVALQPADFRIQRTALIAAPAPEGGGTAVTWSMTGRHNFMAKAFCLFVSMEKMVGGQFEQGLAQMKSIVETPAKT